MIALGRLIALAWLIALCAPVSAQQKGPLKSDFPQQFAFGTPNNGGSLHFKSGVLSHYGLSPNAVAEKAIDILNFQQQAWSTSLPIYWDIYLEDQRLDKTGNLGATTYSRTRKVAGATYPGPKACVLLITLKAIYSEAEVADFETVFEYTLAHEATHCFQRATASAQSETVGYSPADWFMEGSANWLAGDFLQSEGKSYPSFFSEKFEKDHLSGMLKSKGSWHFFFKWLEGAQALGSREPVMGFIKAMLNVPWASCVEPIPVETFAEERPHSYDDHCAGTASPYEEAMPKWFVGKNYKLSMILSLFGSAVVRGSVPGIKNPDKFYSEWEIHSTMADYDARVSAWAVKPTARAPLGKFPVNPAAIAGTGEIDQPNRFGFAVYKIIPVDLIFPKPRVFFWGVEKPDPNAWVTLSRSTSDTRLGDDRWIPSPTLSGQWVSVGIVEEGAGEEANLLITYTQ
ncbi:hypothetical protein [Sphingomonas echinoides]|uniref:Uncharacterized protein n=1 Tax=Sphingomonas echinoides TaxID=59803 RepID=A0ABU4PPV4_9SPHN|nr:hypothetical protein [Sphingomonas echinoides]MDX5985660.1 hypothetical protein [Sphingomonas echinoides]